MSKGVLGLSPASTNILSDDLTTVVESHENIISAEQFTDDLGETPTGFEGSQTFKSVIISILQRFTGAKTVVW